MTRLAVSGPRDLTPDQTRNVRADMTKMFASASAIVSGAQFGVDSVAAAVAETLQIPLILVVPVGFVYNEDLLFISDQVIRAEGGYLKRNDRLAEESDALVAYPTTDEEELRSGTWATVRRFEKLSKPVDYRPLSILDLL